MRNILLAVAVWGVLYGVAEILGVMPRIELPREEAGDAGIREADAGGAVEDYPDASVIDDAGVPPEGVPPDEALLEAASVDAGVDGEADPTGEDAPVAPADDEAPTDPPVETTEPEIEAHLCGSSGARPRLHLARLPNGRGALLVDCGRFAELVVPEPSAGEALIVARFSLSAPLTKVEAVELTGDGRHDLAFAFADRVVLLPSNPFGLWAEPKSLEGWTGGPSSAPTRRTRGKEAPLEIGDESYYVETRGEAFVLTSGAGEPLRLSPAPLVFEAELR